MASPPAVLDREGLEHLIRAGQERNLSAGQIADQILTLLADPRTAKALAHPLRIEILRLIREQGELSPAQIAQRTKASLGTVAYHTRMLNDLGAIELARTRPRRGAIEHIYKLAGQSEADRSGSLPSENEERTSRDPDRAVTVAEAADITGVTRQTIHNWVSTGRLRVIGDGSPIQVALSDLPTGFEPTRNRKKPKPKRARPGTTQA